MAYTLSGKYGVIRFTDHGTVTGESKTMSGKLTSYPVEQNSNISDHFEKDPRRGTLKGVLIDGGAAVATLEKMFETGDVLTYDGSFRESGIVLVSLDFSTSSANRNGFAFTAAYQKADIVGAQYAPIGAETMSEQDSGKSAVARSSSKPAQDGLQTTVTETVSSSAYADYVNTFNSKQEPGSGPLSRATPAYTGG